ncbi:MAG: alpha/beta fold hydrolase [Caldilineales bacterium]|nr:alpha/beta fold hydrolase [Caldilineales bacterium]
MKSFRSFSILMLITLLGFSAACGPGFTQVSVKPARQTPDAHTEVASSATMTSDISPSTPTATRTPTTRPTLMPSSTPTHVAEPTATLSLTITPTPSLESEQSTPAFEIGNELTIAALAQRDIEGSVITVEQQLEDGANYSRYIASYLSEGNKIYGLLTVPFGSPPADGFKAIVFNHGYIPPNVYRTTERYVAYVDTLARNGFVVFKIDLRGFGNSEGEPTGTYFSPDYSIDAISALKSLQTLDYVDAEGIGMWGHSMAGNLVLRAMLVEPEIKAGVIWAGAVYSYDDFTLYAIDDTSYNPAVQTTSRRISQQIRETYGPPDTSKPYWQAVSLTEHLDLLESPLQLHHATNDDVVNIGYSVDLATVLDAANKEYEFYRYDGGGHNIDSPYFNEAMRRTIEFFKENL